MAPGCALASAMTSETELALIDGCKTSTLFKETKAVTGIKSLLGSKGILAYSAGLMA